MSKLRRHDWRSHRKVSCNICEEVLKGRKDIGYHRRLKHGMFKKLMCRFYPSCLDEDECFFSHEESDMRSPICPRGQNCFEQSCQYSDYNHKSLNDMKCRFQENCNRKFCVFQHLVERMSFLGVSHQNKRNT